MRGSSSNHRDNVVSLASYRQQLQAQPKAATGGAAVRLEPAAGQEMVFFITGGRFEWMVNGCVTLVGAGEFIRVPVNAVHDFRDIGGTAGTMLSHRFVAALDAGLYRELAAALPPYTTTLPARQSRLYRQLQAIARRWGIELESGAAA